MSAETLRRAAALMRERAEAATQTAAPWGVDEIGGIWGQEADGQPIPIANNATDADAEHIASWHPAVALAVADWLEAKAEQDDKGPCDGAGTVGVCNLCEHDYGHVAALAVARAYLGEPA